MKLWPATRQQRLLLAAILLAGALLRLWLWWRVPDHQPANDEVEYLQVARDLLAGRGWSFYERYHWLRAPLYPLWLAASLWLARGSLVWAALPNIALGVLCIWLLYLLGREVALGAAGQAQSSSLPERAGLVTAALASVLLTLATFSALWMAETLFTALFVAALVALLRWSRRPRYGTAALAGALLGLAILTRSLPLTWLPFAALWMIVSGSGPHPPTPSPVASDGRRGAGSPSPVRQHGRGSWGVRAVLCSLFFVLCSCVVIAPWTLRNYLAYGSPIPVETGLSYNLWAFNEPREDGDTIFRTLEAIPNPAERADYATAKGIERLREDPAIMLRKLWPNWNYLWRVKPIEDRFLQRSYYEDTPLGMFVLGLVLDDALLYCILLAALGGLVWSPNDRAKLLLGGWLAYVAAVVLLTHGEARYRHFVLPVLLPYAAWLLVCLVGRGKPGPFVETVGAEASSARTGHSIVSKYATQWRWAAVAAGVVLLWSPLVLQYPRDWAARNLLRGYAVQRAEAAGYTPAALAWYERAAEWDPDSADVWLGRGDVLFVKGTEAEALEAYDTAFRRKRLYVPANASRAAALRVFGRLAEARAAFAGFYTDEREMLRWSWENLNWAHPAVLDIGDGLDFGFVNGMHPAEQLGQRRVRWTEPRAELRLGPSTRGIVRLTMSAPRPGGEAVPVEVCARDGACQQLMVDSSWRSYELAVPRFSPVHLTITAPAFDPRSADPASTDERRLGVLLDRAATE